MALNAGLRWAILPKSIATLIVLSKPRANMVNYHDPATIAQEFGTHAFPQISGAWSLIYLSDFSIAVAVKLWHAIDGIFM